MDKCAVNLQVVSCLMALWTCLPAATAQDCSNCTGCGTTTVICDNLGLTSFPQLPVAVQQMVEILWESLFLYPYRHTAVCLCLYSDCPIVKYRATWFQHLMQMCWRTTQTWLRCKSTTASNKHIVLLGRAWASPILASWSMHSACTYVLYVHPATSLCTSCSASS